MMINDNHENDNYRRPCLRPHQINHHSVQLHGDGLHRGNPEASRAQTTGGRTLLAKACWEDIPPAFLQWQAWMGLSSHAQVKTLGRSRMTPAAKPAAVPNEGDVVWVCPAGRFAGRVVLHGYGLCNGQFRELSPPYCMYCQCTATLKRVRKDSSASLVPQVAPDLLAMMQTKVLAVSSFWPSNPYDQEMK